MCPVCWFFDLPFTDKIQIGMLLITLAILLVGYWSLSQSRKDKKIEFTYKVYMDFLAFLNMPENKDIKGWMYGLNSIELSAENKIRLGDLFEKFEAIYSLLKAGTINDEIWYDLISYYVEKASTSVKPTYMEFFKTYQEGDKDTVIKVDDIFKGFHYMLDKAVYMSNNRDNKEPE